MSQPKDWILRRSQTVYNNVLMQRFEMRRRARQDIYIYSIYAYGWDISRATWSDSQCQFTRTLSLFTHGAKQSGRTDYRPSGPTISPGLDLGEL